MRAAEIRRQFPIGTRFVERTDPRQIVHVVRGYLARQPLGNQAEDEEVLVDAHMGFFPSECGPAPVAPFDMIAQLLDRQPQTFAMIEARPNVVEQVLSTAADATATWNQLQERIQQQAEEQRQSEILRREQVRQQAEDQRQRQRVQQGEREQREREQARAVQLAQRQQEQRWAQPDVQVTIEGLQRVISEAQSLLDRLRIKAQTLTSEQDIEGDGSIEEEERLLLIEEDSE